MAKEKQYYIQNGWVGNSVLWWGIDSKGYTTEIDKAGRFTKQQANSIIQRPEDKAWECNHVDKNLKAHKKTIDCQYLNSKYCLKGRKR